MWSYTVVCIWVLHSVCTYIELYPVVQHCEVGKVAQMIITVRSMQHALASNPMLTLPLSSVHWWVSFASVLALLLWIVVIFVFVFVLDEMRCLRRQQQGMERPHAASTSHGNIYHCFEIRILWFKWPGVGWWKWWRNGGWVLTGCCGLHDILRHRTEPTALALSTPLLSMFRSPAHARIRIAGCCRRDEVSGVDGDSRRSGEMAGEPMEFTDLGVGEDENENGAELSDRILDVWFGHANLTSVISEGRHVSDWAAGNDRMTGIRVVVKVFWRSHVWKFDLFDG